MNKYILFFALLASLVSCKKGQLIEKPSLKTVTVGSYSAIPDDSYTVYVNDVPMRNKITSGGTQFITIKSYNNEIRLKVFTQEGKQLLYDTVVVVEPTRISFTILQLDASGKAKPALKGGMGVDIPENHSEISLLYDERLLPETMQFDMYIIKQKFYNGNWLYDGVDTLGHFPVVKRGEVSEPQLISLDYDLSACAVIFKPMNHAGEIIPGVTIIPQDFNAPFAGIYDSQYKHIILKIDAYDNGDGSFLFAGNPLAFY